jgi:tetratricopeptide (TPR) repeat protein
LGDLEAGAEALERSLEIQLQVHGASSSLTSNTARNVAMLYGILGRYAEAIPLQRIALEASANQRSVAYVAAQLAFLEGRALTANGEPPDERFQTVLRTLRQSQAELEAMRTSGEDRYPSDVKLFLARLLLVAGQGDEALTLARQALADRLDDEAPNEGRVAQARLIEARARLFLRHPEAEADLRQALVDFEAWGRHERLEALLARRQLGME